jgi:hypothetical protein
MLGIIPLCMVPTLSHTAKRSVSSFDGADARAFTSVDLSRTCCLAECVFGANARWVYKRDELGNTRAIDSLKMHELNIER